MSTDWHAFLYGSFDAAGVMTVDKPPLALWVQALSARVFGFNSLALLVPQALMGVASVGLVYDLVRRRFGRAGGFAAGLVLALTPITVAISRHNNPDALLVLCCVAALWCVVRALEDGRTRWLVLAGVAVGLGFEAKMAAALHGRARDRRRVPVGRPARPPGGAAAAARGRRRDGRRRRRMAGADRAHARRARPWVSGTSDNSIWSLIFGYNGLGRLGGQAGGPGGASGGGGGGGVFGGDPGVLRLLDSSLGGQAGWLLGFARRRRRSRVVAASRLRRDRRPHRLADRRRRGVRGRPRWRSAPRRGSSTRTTSRCSRRSRRRSWAAASRSSPAAGRGARSLAPVAVVAGMATELAVLDKLPGRARDGRARSWR